MDLTKPELLCFSLVDYDTGYPFPTPKKEDVMSEKGSNKKTKKETTEKPKGFNESHKKDCKCQACLMASGCPLKPSFKKNVVEK